MARRILFAIIAPCSFGVPVFFVIFAVVATSVRGATIVWDGDGNSPPHGAFKSANNWNPNQVPGVGDRALFNSAKSYAVTFVQNEQIDKLFVSDGKVDMVSDSATVHSLTLTPDGGVTDADITVDGNSTLRIGKAGFPMEVHGDDAILFVGVNSNGTTEVVGTGSVLTARGNSRTHPVGAVGGLGTLNVTSDAKANIGFNLGSEGTLDVGVSNTGSSQGIVLVDLGGTLNAGNLSIGTRSSAATGIVTVDGSGSLIKVLAITLVGSASGGTGAIEITGDGTFDTGTGTTTINATGSVNIDDGALHARSDLLVDGGLFTLGDDGFFNLDGNDFTASNGAQVNFTSPFFLEEVETFLIDSGADFTTTSPFMLGLDVGGNLIVDGVDSTFTAGTLTVGNVGLGSGSGTNIVTLRNRATATISDELNISVSTFDDQTVDLLSVDSDSDLIAGNINVGTGTMGQGTLALNGDSTITQNGASMLTLGSTTGSGSGTLNVGSGQFTTGTGITTINATGSLNLNNGTFTANSDIMIGPGGTLKLAGGRLVANGDLLIDGGNLIVGDGDDLDLATSNALTASNDAQINFQIASYIVENGTTLEINSGADATICTLIVGDVGTGGTWIVDGIGSTFNAGTVTIGRFGGMGVATLRNSANANIIGPLILGDSSFAGVGMLNVESGADLSVAGIRIGKGDEGSGILLVTGNGSTITQSGTSTLIIGGTLASSGELTLENGSTFTTGTGTTTINATGTINLTGGALNAKTIDHTSGGTFNFSGGLLNVEIFDGDLTNAGGTLAPGQSAGSTLVMGDYTQQTGATLAIEIGGLLSASEYDLVSIVGTASLDGTLDVSLLGGFSPLAGDTFETLSAAGGLSGTFATENLPALTGQLFWNVDYDTLNDLVVLEVLSPFTADFDLDGDVDGDDLNDAVDGWQARFGADLDGGNFLDWQHQFGSGIPPLGADSTGRASSLAVPEPSAFGLCCLALAPWCLRRAACK